MINMLETVCTSDINSCCSDYGIATYLSMMKNILNMIHIVVPILLMLFLAINFTQLMMDPDDQKKVKMHSLKNKCIAAVVVFFLPYMMELFINVISIGDFAPEDFNLAACYRAADDTTTVMHETEEYDAIKPIKKTKISYDIELNDDSDIEITSDDSNMSGSKEGKKIVKYAKKFIGNKYVWGGTSLTNGTDCSGFTMQVYKHFGYSLPRTSAAQAKAGKKVSSLKEAQAGDLIHYDGHIAIYEGNGKIVHASNARDGIKESTATYRQILDIRRII